MHHARATVVPRTSHRPNIDAINELLTTDSQAQEQLDQLLKALTTILNAK